MGIYPVNFEPAFNMMAAGTAEEGNEIRFKIINCSFENELNGFYSSGKTLYQLKFKLDQRRQLTEFLGTGDTFSGKELTTCPGLIVNPGRGSFGVTLDECYGFMNSLGNVYLDVELNDRLLLEELPKRLRNQFYKHYNDEAFHSMFRKLVKEPNFL